MKRCIAAAALVLAVSGCEALLEELGLGPILEEDANFTLVLTSDPIDPAATLHAADLTTAGNVPLSAVSSIDMTVHGVDVRPADGGAWRTVDVAAGGVPIDVMALSGAQILLASDELPAGLYMDARLHIDGATLMLDEDVCLQEPGETVEPVCLAAGTAYQVAIPSADETGIKTDAGFEVPEGGSVEVELVLDPEATVLSIAWAPGLGIVMAPVIRAAGDPGDTGGE